MIGQNSFSDIFGEEFGFSGKEDLVEAKPQKANKKKAEKGKSDRELTLPVHVYGMGFEVIVTAREEEAENATITSAELLKRLDELGYPEVLNCHRALFIPENETSTAYIVVGQNIFTAVSEDTLVDLSDDKQVIFAYGMQKIMFAADMFEGTDLDEITVKMLTDKIIEYMPKFSGATMCYDIESNTIVPLWKSSNILSAKQVISLPASVSFLENTVTMTEDDIENPTAKKVLDFLCKKISKTGLDFKLAQSENEELFVVMEATSKISSSSNDKRNKGATTQKKKEKFQLPFTVYLTMNGHRELLTPEMFGGKEKITGDDITAFYSGKFSIFKSAEKKKGLHFTFDSTAKILSVDSTPGRRGSGRFYNAAYDYEERECYNNSANSEGLLITSSLELNDMLKNPERSGMGTICSKSLPYNGYTVHSTQMAAFIYRDAGDTPADVGMVLKVPKVPYRFFEHVVAIFKRALPNEAILRLLYDHRSKTYVIDQPTEMKATHYDVRSKFAPTPHWCDVVATIHSHNYMEAFFSPTDNEAEKYDRGLFGVIGRINTKNPEMRLRIAVDGGFTEVPPSFLFEQEGGAFYG